MLVKYGDLVADYYSVPNNNKLVIVASWAPWLPTGSDSTAWLWLAAGYDVVCPHYYGFAASGGDFTPMNCIQTILDTKKTFLDWTVYDVFAMTSLHVHYNEFLIVGRSFGGRVAAMLPKFDASLTKVGLFYPLLWHKPLNDPETTEETTDDFLTIIKEWLTPLYRWIDDERWVSHFDDSSDLIPFYHFEHLKNVAVFGAHGTADSVIYASRTEDFFGKLQERNPSGRYSYYPYYGLWHGATTKLAATEGMLHRLEN